MVGELVYLRWSHSDATTSTARPGLVIAGPDGQGDLVLLKVTGRRGYANAVSLETCDLARGEMHKPSFIRTDRFTTLHVSQVEERGKGVAGKKMAEVFKLLACRNSVAFSGLAHRANRPGAENALPFEPGETVVPYAGRVFTEDEVEAAVSSTLDFWLTLGPEGEEFERELAKVLGVKRSLLVNSGSSANLVALSALTSHKLGEKRIRPGDEVITCAAGFPTTVAPILRNGAVPRAVSRRTSNRQPDAFRRKSASSAGLRAVARGTSRRAPDPRRHARRRPHYERIDFCRGLPRPHARDAGLRRRDDPRVLQKSVSSGLPRVNPLAQDLEHVLVHTQGLWEPIRGKSIFVTGGTGFFGRWILESFVRANTALDLGAHLVVLSRNPDFFRQKAPQLSGADALTFVKGDVCSFTASDVRAQLPGPLANFGFVIHAETESGSNLGDVNRSPCSIRSCRARGARSSLRGKPVQVAFCSSAPAQSTDASLVR